MKSSFSQNERGNAAVEYALLLLVLTGAVLALSLLGAPGLIKAFGQAAHALNPLTIIANWP